MNHLIYTSYLDKPEKIPLAEHNLKSLKRFFNRTTLIYSSADEKTLTYPDNFCGLKKEDINLIKNYGYDFGKMHFGLEKLGDFKGKYVAVINDSVSVRKDLAECFLKINNLIKEGVEYIGYIGSHEIKKHYQSWFWVLTKPTINYLISHINFALNDKQQAILFNEVNLSHNMINKFNSQCLYGPYTGNLMYLDHSFIKTESLSFVKNNLFNRNFIKSQNNPRLKFNESLQDLEFHNPQTLKLINKYIT